MNLTDLQVELRSMEEHLSSLQAEIEKMKPQPEDKKKLEYATISELAAKHPIQNVALGNQSPLIKKKYVSCLSFLATRCVDGIYEKLLYINRISAATQLDLSAEEINRLGLDFDNGDLDKLCVDLCDVRYSLLTDAFIVANLTHSASSEMLAVIADMAKLLGCDNSELHMTAIVAKATVTSDWSLLEHLPASVQKPWGNKFSSHIPNRWIISHRVRSARICTAESETKSAAVVGGVYASIFKSLSVETPEIKHPCTVKTVIQNESLVKKGTEILNYVDTTKLFKDVIGAARIARSATLFAKNQSSTPEKAIDPISIKAPCDGVFYSIEEQSLNKNTNQNDTYLVAYVVSYFDDYQELCAWHKKNKKS